MKKYLFGFIFILLISSSVHLPGLSDKRKQHKTERRRNVLDSLTNYMLILDSIKSKLDSSRIDLINVEQILESQSKLLGDSIN